MKRYLFLAAFMCLTLLSNAQKIVYTPEGLRSSVKTSEKFVEFQSLELGQDALYKHCVAELEKVQYLQYSFDRKVNQEVTLYGYIDSPSFILWGTTSLRFVMQIIFEGDKVKVGVDLTKSNGKDINYGRLYNKKREVRVPIAKNKIEDELNLIITNVFSTKLRFE